MTATRGAAAILLAIVAGAACAGQPGAGGPAPSAAPATDIYLYELESGGGTGRLRNLTHRRGYDNQPAWDGSDRLLYTSEHGGQTDIYAIRLSSGRIHRVTATPESEYSPTPAPDGGIAVVRVERDSTQRLWRFSPSGDSASVILRDVKPVGYFAWLDANTLALFVLGNPNTLRIADARAGAEWVVASDIGRSLQRVPGTRLGSFLHRSGSRWVLKTVDPARRMDGSFAIDSVAVMPDSADYVAWQTSSELLTVAGSRVLRMRLPGGTWEVVADLAGLGVIGLSRLALSPDGRRLALVAQDH
jgi:hypothetical protein